MNKYTNLKVAAENAWDAANADCMNEDLFKAAEKASEEVDVYAAKLASKRKHFEALCDNDKVDPACCRENAGDATGWTEGDVEFWDICVNTAENFIAGVYA